MWTHPTAIDTLVTWTAAQHVWRQRLDPDDQFSPLVPFIAPDTVLRDFAEYILSIDAISRLNAYSTRDFSGARFPDCKHIAFANRDANHPTYDVERELQALIDGKATRPPDHASPSEFHGHINPTFRNPRGTVAAILPYMHRAPTGIYSEAAAIRRGTLLNQARAVRHARSVSIDAGLAATVAANWTAARAELLAHVQAIYPERGYT
jgi:hypothetical protein